jgi:histone-lysine N-methyltransferase SETMAR
LVITPLSKIPWKDGSEGLEREESTSDAKRAGKLRAATDELHQEQLGQFLAQSRSWSTRQLSFELNVSKDSIVDMIHNVFNMKKICAKWVPHVLTPQQQAMRESIAASLLSRYHSQRETFQRVPAIDETWVKCYHPLIQQQAKEWHSPEEPR